MRRQLQRHNTQPSNHSRHTLHRELTVVLEHKCDTVQKQRGVRVVVGLCSAQGELVKVGVELFDVDCDGAAVRFECGESCHQTVASAFERQLRAAIQTTHITSHHLRNGQTKRGKSCKRYSAFSAISRFKHSSRSNTSSKLMRCANLHRKYQNKYLRIQ